MRTERMARMPDVHAKLSPSSSHRWLNCTKSFDLIESAKVPEQTAGVAAEEGTLAHAVLENLMKQALGKVSAAEYKAERKRLAEEAEKLLGRPAISEMEKFASGQVEFILDQLRDDPSAAVLIEQRVWVTEQCFGTADAIVVSGTTLYVIDYKYGAGIPVNAVENTQLLLYGAGALRFWDLVYDIQEVELHIFQPRRNSHSEFRLSADELRSWVDTKVLPAVEEINTSTGSFCPSDKICQWCPVNAVCSARANAMWGFLLQEGVLTDD